jgi:hypothetical protein
MLASDRFAGDDSAGVLGRAEAAEPYRAERAHTYGGLIGQLPGLFHDPILAAKVGNGELTNSGRILEEMASRSSLFLPQGAQQISDDLTKAFCAKPIQAKQEPASTAACALLDERTTRFTLS